VHGGAAAGVRFDLRRIGRLCVVVVGRFPLAQIVRGTIAASDEHESRNDEPDGMA
jgi:hypothetical protein